MYVFYMFYYTLKKQSLNLNQIGKFGINKLLMKYSIKFQL